MERIFLWHFISWIQYKNILLLAGFARLPFGSSANGLVFDDFFSTPRPKLHFMERRRDDSHGKKPIFLFWMSWRDFLQNFQIFEVTSAPWDHVCACQGWVRRCERRRQLPPALLPGSAPSPAAHPLSAPQASSPVTSPAPEQSHQERQVWQLGAW